MELFLTQKWAPQNVHNVHNVHNTKRLSPLKHQASTPPEPSEQTAPTP